MSRWFQTAAGLPRWTALLAALVLTARAAAQEPLFTFVQVSDSQPETSEHDQAFVDVLSTIAAAGQAGAILPRPVDLVLFAGDITYGNTRSEWVAAKQKLDTWLTANDIPFLAVPGNHDVNNGDTSLYEEFIGTSDVWDAGSAAFTGHNARARTTGWNGLRFIGVDSTNSAWNTYSNADLAAVAARLSAAAAAGENAFLLTHHPHDGQGRIPLASLLTNTSLVGYLRGHTGSPHATKGLAGVVNPVVWDVNTNAIYQDRCLVYFEVYPTQLRSYVVVLDNGPFLPPAVTIPLAHALTLASEPNHGIADGLHTLARPTPTGSVPERKLWHRAGDWWGVLWNNAAGAYRIQRLDRGSQTWIDTGPSVSASSGRSFDALAEGDVVAIASNLPATPGQEALGSPGLLTRFVFSEGHGTYELEEAYPAPINDARSPTLVLARDSIGTLWAAWTRAGSAFVAHSLGSDDAWSAPIALAGGLGAADTVALASFGGSVGALWSNSTAGTLAFARHVDGDLSTAWTIEVASADGALVGSTLDLVAADGRALAAVRAGGGALNLLERSTSGTWSVHPLGTAADGLDSPLLVVDRALARLRLFATGPTPAGQSVSGGGALYQKLSPLAAIDFPAGRGSPAVQDGTHPSAGFATSTRQSVNGSSALAVLGSVAQTDRYWHAFDALATLPPAPVAEFTATSLSGPAPLAVDFTDLSSGAPTHWSWDFGDGATSTEHEPQHVYAQPGTFTVILTASSGAGEDVRTRTAYVVVGAPSPVRTFTPVADARVNEASPTGNSGSASELRVKNELGSSYQSFLRFDLSDLGAGTVTSVKLRLFCTDASNGGGSIYRIASNAWSETGITWNNRPPLPAGPHSVMGGVTNGFWTEQELGPGAIEAGLVSLALAGGTTNSALYSSREGVNPPQLVVTAAGGGSPPSADFTGSPLTGPAPHSVTFTDASTGGPTGWVWDFGDGSTSSTRNPVHTYAQPGTYTVMLEVSSPGGLASETRLDYVTVTAPPPVRTFRPAADARVTESSATKNFGPETSLRVRSLSGGSSQSFLRFDLTSLTGAVLSAKLRIFCTDAGTSGGRLVAAPTTWTESGITWNNRPALPGSSLATLGAVVLNQWYELDVTSAVTGPGQIAFALAGGNSNTVLYSSREGANPPELVVTTGAAIPPSADFAATPLTGLSPLSVAFTDQSLSAISWAWDFGDGAGSSAQNPVHVYTTPGTYSVTLVASNSVGSATAERIDLIHVSPPAPSRTFLPIADTRVYEASPSSTAGLATVLRVRQSAGESYHTYLRFDLSTLSGNVVSAKLRLFSTDGSDVGGRVFPTTGSWNETTLTWNNKPAPSEPLITGLGGVTTGTWAEFDVTSAVTGGGTLNLLLQSTSSNSCYYSSREGANPPELVVETTTP